MSIQKRAVVAAAAIGILSASTAAIGAGPGYGFPGFDIVNSIISASFMTDVSKTPKRHANRTHFPECKFVMVERWSKRRGENVMRKTKVCE